MQYLLRQTFLLDVEAMQAICQRGWYKVKDASAMVLEGFAVTEVNLMQAANILTGSISALVNAEGRVEDDADKEIVPNV